MNKPSVLKPTLPPLLIVIVDSSLMIAGTNMPQWLLGAVLGAAILWLALSAIGIRGAVIERWPWARTWFPFLDPTGGLAATSELRARHLQGLHLRLALVAENNVVSDRTFEDCVIYGPAVVAPVGYVSHYDCTYTCKNPDQLYLVLDTFVPNKTQDHELPAGLLLVERCVFRRCQFIGISTLTNKEAKDADLARMTIPPRPTPQPEQPHET